MLLYEVLLYSQVCSRRARIGNKSYKLRSHQIWGCYGNPARPIFFLIKTQCYSSDGLQHNWQQLSSHTCRCHVTAVYFRLQLPITCLGNLLHRTANNRSWLCGHTVAVHPCLLLSQRRIWCENSLIVLYQTSWACWVNGTGVILTLTSQWIIKMILDL